MKSPIFENGNFYHVFNRGVEKRNIFMDKSDYYRFIHDLYEFNDKNMVVNVVYHTDKNYGSPTSENRKPRELLVEIICYCLMPNHYHLLLRQRIDNGVSKFLQKLGVGYTHYFNQRHKRSGVLFQGKTKVVFVKNDAQFTHLSRYIHLNPVELIESKWKEHGINNWKKAKEKLEKYRWSSYLDYISKRNFPSLINKKPILDYFDNKEKYKKFIEEWALKDIGYIEDLVIE